MLAVCLAIWSAATAASGLAPGFASLLVLRILVGVGEAGAIPISLATIADAYPQEKRSVAMSIYYMGIPSGIILGLLIGGWFAQADKWRAAFLTVGTPGLCLAVAVLKLLHEPPRGHADGAGGRSGAGLEGPPRSGRRRAGGAGADAGEGPGAVALVEIGETSAAVRGRHGHGGSGAEDAEASGGEEGPLAAWAERAGDSPAGPPEGQATLKEQMQELFGCRTFVYLLIGGACNLFTAIGAPGGAVCKHAAISHTHSPLPPPLRDRAEQGRSPSCPASSRGASAPPRASPAARSAA